MRRQGSQHCSWRNRSNRHRSMQVKARVIRIVAICWLRCVARQPGKEEYEQGERCASGACLAHVRSHLVRSHSAEFAHALSASHQVVPGMVCYTTNNIAQLERIISAMGVNQARDRASKHQGQFIGPRSLQTKAEVCWNGCPSRGRAKLEDPHPQLSPALCAWLPKLWLHQPASSPIGRVTT